MIHQIIIAPTGIGPTRFAIGLRTQNDILHAPFGIGIQKDGDIIELPGQGELFGKVDDDFLIVGISGLKDIFRNGPVETRFDDQLFATEFF